MRVVTLTTPDPVFTSRLPGIGEGAIRELGDSLFGKSPTFICGGELGEFADRASAQTRMLWSDRRVSLSARKGVTKMRFDRRDIFEDVASTILVFFTLIIATNILTEAGLSFLGAGVRLPNPSWGNLIASGQDQIQTAPWLSLIPGIAIVLTVLSLNIFGDGLRDALDPRAKVRIEH